jgi:hypothetical protein
LNDLVPPAGKGWQPVSGVGRAVAAHHPMRLDVDLDIDLDLASGAENIVDFERLIDLGKPFGTIGGAAAATFVERQIQLPQQAHDLLARRHMPEARTGAEGRFVEVVEGGETAWKEFPIHHPFGETVYRPKPQP